MQINYDKVRQRILDLRTNSGLIQEEVAELAELAYKHYQSVESGRTKDIRYSTIVKIANGYGLEDWQLLHPDEPAMSAQTQRRIESLKKRRKPVRK